MFYTSNLLWGFVQWQNLYNFGSMQDAMKIAEDKVKLFLLQSALLKKLPLKYRAHTVNSSLLDEFCKAKDGKVYPFYEVSKWDHCNLTCTWKSRDDLSCILGIGIAFYSGLTTMYLRKKLTVTDTWLWNSNIPTALTPSHTESPHESLGAIEHNCPEIGASRLFYLGSVRRVFIYEVVFEKY